MYQCEKLDGMAVHRSWTYITPNKGILKKTIGHGTFWLSAISLSGRRMSPPDVCIGTSPTFFAAMAALRKARSSKVPFIMEVRDLWPACFVELGVLQNRFLIRVLEKWEMALYRRATQIVTVTESFRDNLAARGVPAQKLSSIPNAADVEYWKPMQASTQLVSKLRVEGKFVVLYIGAHGISQALVRVLEAARRLKNESKIQFIFVGDGAEKDQLIKQAKTDGLTNVEFHDSVDKLQVREFYSVADVCIVPLRNIPLFKTFIPSKMFEMLAMERPIVASVSGEAADILRRSGGALIVEPEDSRGIASAILRLFQDEVLGCEMGKCGRRFVIDHYSRKAMADRYLDVIGSAIATG